MPIEYTDETGYKHIVTIAKVYGQIMDKIDSTIHINYRFEHKLDDMDKINFIDSVGIYLDLYHPEVGITRSIECDSVSSALSELYNLPMVSGLWHTWAISIMIIGHNHIGQYGMANLTFGTE